MDKFPKMETIEATLFGQRIDGLSGATELSIELLRSCPEFVTTNLASLETVGKMAVYGHRGAEIAMSVVLAQILQVGVIAERARAECEQLTSAMIPEKGGGLCHRDGSCETLT